MKMISKIKDETPQHKDGCEPVVVLQARKSLLPLSLLPLILESLLPLPLVLATSSFAAAIVLHLAVASSAL